MRQSLLLSICGYKHSGKTTLIEALLPVLQSEGLKTAVIKHHGHRFTPDAPGTDSRRFQQAGACGTAVYDGETYQIVHRSRASALELAKAFPEADIILLEGGKCLPVPHIVLVRDGAAPPPTSGPLLAYVSNQPAPGGAPTFAHSDIRGISALISRWIADHRESTEYSF